MSETVVVHLPSAYENMIAHQLMERMRRNESTPVCVPSATIPVEHDEELHKYTIVLEATKHEEYIDKLKGRCKIHGCGTLPMYDGRYCSQKHANMARSQR